MTPSTASPDTLDLTPLRQDVRGAVTSPDDAPYDNARAIWNGMIDRRPAAIVTPADAADVAAVVRWASANGVAVTALGGGHGVAGTSLTDGGIVCDMAALKDVDVDVESGIVLAGAGCTLGDLDAATQAHGLAVPVGVVTETGIAGLTLSGGMGWLRRARGLSCDNLLAVEMVTARGEVLRSTERENGEVWWAARGGGGVPGIVTQFTYQAYPVGPEITWCFVVYPRASAASVLRGVDSYVAEGHRAVSPVVVLGRVPDVEAFPPQWRGKEMAVVVALYPDASKTATAELAPLRSLGQPIADFSGPMPYCTAQSFLDEDYPKGDHYYWKSLGYQSLDGVIDELVSIAASAPSKRSTVDIWFNSGAMQEVDPATTSYGHRAPYLVSLEACWPADADDERNVSWARDAWSTLHPGSDGSTYLNFPGFFEDGDAMRRASHGDENHARLRALRAAMDPTGMFG